MATTTTIPRPGMSDYRPRRAPSAEYWFEAETFTEGVTVLRTHDASEAFALAAACLRERRTHGNQERLSDGEFVWLRRDRGRNWGRVDSGKPGSIPAVIFTVVSS